MSPIHIEHESMKKADQLSGGVQTSNGLLDNYKWKDERDEEVITEMRGDQKVDQQD